ncbi:MAG: NAD-dependent epimerase/dehydratase family protein [Deltaproteobacteria bacterium]|nr:NAD-dependent epimerase/dehydratase family protein [Deltaproteobacteria bacterium]
MKIVVTGGSGKVGTYVVQELLEAKHEVTIFDPFPPSQLTGVRWIKGDLQDLGQVISGFAGIDAVVHLAAYPIPYREIPDHVLFTNNTVATYNVHEAAFRLGISKVVQMSSGAIVGWAYGTKNFGPEYLPVDENHPLSPPGSLWSVETLRRAYWPILYSEVRYGHHCSKARMGFIS